MSLPEFKLLRPRTLAEALDLLARHAPAETTSIPPMRPGSGRSQLEIIAGGTDLVPSLKQRLFMPYYVLDIRRIAELRGIQPKNGQGVSIGALTTLTEIERSDFIRTNYPVLREAARTVASPVLRNMGTIGGNICLDTRCLWYNQSLTWRKACGFCIKKDGELCHVAPGGKKCWAVFSADTPPALLCLDAELEIAGPSGTRRLPLREFYTDLGDCRMRLARNELLTRVMLPEHTARYRGVYQKLRIRGSIDYPLAAVAVVIKSNGHVEDARLAITAVNPAPRLIRGVRELVAGKRLDDTLASAVGELAARMAKPLTTSALTPEYRREMVRVFAKRAVLKAAAGY